MTPKDGGQMTPEEFLEKLVQAIEVFAPVIRETGESFVTINSNFQTLFDRFDKDHAQTKANFEAVHRDMVTTQGNIEALLETSRSHERRLGLLEKEAPTGPIRKETTS